MLLQKKNEQSRSASDVLSGLRENLSALTSSGLYVEKSECRGVWMVTFSEGF